MEAKTIVNQTRLKAVSLILFVALLSTPIIAKASGWTSVGGGMGHCNNNPSAPPYTVSYEEFHLFGITWASRTVYRDGNNNQIADSCATGGGNQQ